MSFKAKTLILGVGNPLRGDDGAGFQVIEELRGAKEFEIAKDDSASNAEFEWNYQLTVEDSERWSRFEQVIVIDVHSEQDELLKISQLGFGNFNLILNTLSQSPMGSHSLQPEEVWAMTLICFGWAPKLGVLSLKAECFEPGAPLSEVSKASVQAVLLHLKDLESIGESIR